MRIRIRVYMLMLGTAVVLIVVLLGSRPLTTPLTLELVGLTNIPPTVPALPVWTARDAQGEVSGLTAASPSHVLFKVSNRTGRSLPFRFALYQFADSVPAGVTVPNGPSRHRAGTVHELPVELHAYKGMYFGPPDRDLFDSGTLAPRETALIALPRPPFDCVWRTSVSYKLPLTHPETLKYVIKRRLRIPEVHDVHGTPQGLAYDEWIYGAWITNAVLNQTVQRTGASRSAQETNRPSPAAGSRR